MWEKEVKMETTKKQIDVLDKTVVFLQKREGIDKVRCTFAFFLSDTHGTIHFQSSLQTLKVIRYASKLALALDVDLKQLETLESSIGTSRKAYRLGKFLQNVNTVRRIQLHQPHSTLELIAAVGDGIYYFVEQFQWLVKVGVIPATLSPRLTKISASAELLGYSASIVLALLRLHFLLEREVALIAELNRRRRMRRQQRQQEQEQDEAELKGKDDILISEIRQLRARRALRTLGLAQDLADALLAVSDLRSGSRYGGVGGGGSF